MSKSAHEVFLLRQGAASPFRIPRANVLAVDGFNSVRIVRMREMPSSRTPAACQCLKSQNFYVLLVLHPARGLLSELRGLDLCDASLFSSLTGTIPTEL
jgi:hypothetical protein